MTFLSKLLASFDSFMSALMAAFGEIKTGQPIPLLIRRDLPIGQPATKILFKRRIT